MSGLLCSCSALWNPFGGGGGEKRTIEYTTKFSLAVGGVASGRDELVFFDENNRVRDLSDRKIDCTADEDIVHFGPRPGNDTIAKGSGVLIVPTEAGIATVTCFIDDAPVDDKYKIIVSPQNLIQILLAEAGAQLADEATTDDKVVGLESESVTGNAIATVIRNRIDLIKSNGEPELFSVDAAEFDADPNISYYDAVITAPGQFSPTNPSDPSYEIFNLAEDREFLEDDWHVAYDQAVLTSAGIYDEDIADPTGGAFAFLSPTAEQWTIISEALSSGTLDMPEGAGVTDDNFPAFAPLQIVIVDGTWRYDDGRPAFIFIRHRSADKPAVTGQP